MEGAYIGLLIGGMIALSGLLSLWRPDLLSPFSGMSKTELDKVDLKHAGKSACAVLIAAGIVSAAVNWFLCAVGYADAGITVMVLTIVLGGIILMAVMRKYDSNPSAWRRDNFHGAVFPCGRNFAARVVPSERDRSQRRQGGHIRELRNGSSIG